jgi:hypothetical protein
MNEGRPETPDRLTGGDLAMKKVLALVILVGLAATPAFAQKVYIDYAHDYDFDGVESFTYVNTEESNSSNPMMAQRIEGMIKQSLRDGGLTEMPEGGDIYVTYHVTTQERTSYTTTNFGYGGYWGGWHGWGAGMGTSTTTAQNYTDGTLIIDAYDGTEKKMIWRATGTVTVKAKPERQVQQVEKILAKIGKRWQKILAGQGK